MIIEGSDLAVSLNRQFRFVVRELAGLPDDVLNRELPFQPANTLYQLGVHIAGSARWWSITNTGGIDFHRNRPAEFVATGSGSGLFIDYELLMSQVERHLGNLSAAHLDRPVTIAEASMSHWTGRAPLSQRDGVLHAIEHTGLHLGQIQLTRQLFGFTPPANED